MAGTSGRGSAKLSAPAIAIKGKLKGAKIIDWQELGQPNPELITGVVQTTAASFKANLALLTKLKELRDLHILIRGTRVPISRRSTLLSEARRPMQGPAGKYPIVQVHPLSARK
jgi:hypothetical protein